MTKHLKHGQIGYFSMQVMINDNVKYVFLIGSKGIPANYGGFETFVEKLTRYKKSDDIRYFVSCQKSINDNLDLYVYNGAICFPIRVPNIGSAKAVYYDFKSFLWSISFIEKNRIKDAVIFVCACRIGPFICLYHNKLRKLGIHLVINPDGHEWLRAKWNAVIKCYWRFSEKLCVKYSDFLVCDSKNIEIYIKNQFKEFNPKTTFIAYGSDNSKSTLSDDDSKIVDFYKKWDLKPKEYFVNIARIVPENNYETMVREFMASNTKKSFVICASLENCKYYNVLKEKLNFTNDNRVKFVDGIYDQELLKKIRENAFAYIHGHSVGGTNPSLLEALGTLDLNLLYDCGFNKEVAEEGALYWNLDIGNLAKLINEIENMSQGEIKKLSKLAKKRIANEYTWDKICTEYENVFEQY